jgi:hypothetical protein
MFSAGAKAARAERFAAEAAAGGPAPIKKTFAHPEKISVGGDPVGALLNLCRRRLAAGHALSDAQLRGLADYGLSPHDIETTGPVKHHAPLIYTEHGLGSCAPGERTSKAPKGVVVATAAKATRHPVKQAGDAKAVGRGRSAAGARKGVGVATKRKRPDSLKAAPAKSAAEAGAGKSAAEAGAGTDHARTRSKSKTDLARSKAKRLHVAGE